MSTPPYQLTQHDKFASWLRQIRSCTDVAEFNDMYDAGIVYSCLDRIRSDLRQSGKSVDAWADEWAYSLSQGDEAAKILNKDRKLSLELLYMLINRWKGTKEPQTLTAEDIVHGFGDKRIMGILGLCLPMDRASALHNMTVAGESHPGMHWVSEIHVARDPKWAERMKDYEGFPTMNRRFLWLMEDEAFAGLRLRYSKFMRKYTAPVEAHDWSQV